MSDVVWFCIAFLQFPRSAQAEIALSPNFFTSLHFYRMMELGEQIRGRRKFFQNLFENSSVLPPVFLLLVRGYFGRRENHRPLALLKATPVSLLRSCRKTAAKI